MFYWTKKAKPPRHSKRSLDELRAQLKTLDQERMRELRGGQGPKKPEPMLHSCGGWLPQ